jgi:hypothetical protein
MRKAAVWGVAILMSIESVSFAQEDGCKMIPSLTPARDTASDLRCFPQRIALSSSAHEDSRTSPLSIVLASVGGAGIATFIGFGIAGASQFNNGSLPAQVRDEVRIDYAIANVALAVGLTALVTGIVLMLTHH